MAQPPDNQGHELTRYLRILYDRRWVVLTVLCAGIGMFAWWASKQQKIYQAVATVVVDASPPQVLGDQVRDVVQVGPGQFYGMEEYIQTQRRVLGSDSLARRTVQRLKLDTDTAFWGGELPKDAEEAALVFAGGVTVDPVVDTQVITISYRHPVPEQAKRAVDGLINAYIDSNLQLRDSSNFEASRWLADEADSLRRRLHDAEVALYDFKHKNDLLSVSLEDKINNVTRQMDKLSDALTETRLRKWTSASEAGELAHMADLDPTLIAPNGAHGADTLSSLKGSLAEEERKLSELRARYEPAHPLVKQQAAKVVAVQDSMRREVALQIRGAQARTNEASEQEKKIVTQLDTVKQEGLRVTRLEIEYNKLKREADSLSKQYTMVEARTKETQLASKVKVNNLHVLDYARLPTFAVSPHLTRSAMLALVASLLMGILLALLVDALDRSLKTQEDVETKLGVPFLGVMPHVDNAEPGRLDMYVADHPQSPAAECARLIRTNLLFAGLSRPLRRLLVTSPTALEGKTMTTISLGVVMAQAGSKVLLIDSDLRRPRLKTALGMTNEIGLTNVLLGTETLEKAILPTGIPNLFVLLSGPVPPNPADLVDGARYREVIDECAVKFERVIIDSPPAVPVTDPAIVASYCDGVLMVIRSGKTSQDQARRAWRNLSDVGARILGAVLNDCDLRRRGYGAYRYGYGYYGGREGRSARRA
jgi:capsular exopolysaccharide synthesis family protein